MWALSYAWVSTKNQVEPGSLEQQKNWIRRFCKLQGHELLRSSFGICGGGAGDRSGVDASRKGKGKAQGRICHRPQKKLDEREIRRLYELGLSARSIGKILGVSHNTVLSRLRKMGVRIR
ncbi:MAG: helix-turn-helix domain-containing protein [Candidatus Methanosuratincola sp.]